MIPEEKLTPEEEASRAAWMAKQTPQQLAAWTRSRDARRAYMHARSRDARRAYMHAKFVLLPAKVAKEKAVVDAAIAAYADAVTAAGIALSIPRLWDEYNAASADWQEIM